MVCNYVLSTKDTAMLKQYSVRSKTRDNMIFICVNEIYRRESLSAAIKSLGQFPVE